MNGRRDMKKKTDLTIDGVLLTDAEAREYLRTHARVAFWCWFGAWRMKVLARVTCGAAFMLGLRRPSHIILCDGFEWQRARKG
jgi:hypothetical protein